MIMPQVTVAIPVLNGGAVLDEVLRAVRCQRLPGEVELLVCDSGSDDGSVTLARSHGARVIEIEPAQFSHGGTRNLLMREARAPFVAFLTQDATPAGDEWLAELLTSFALAEDVALVHGPYVARASHPVAVRRELEEFFCALAPGPVIDRASEDPGWRDVSSRATFFTDANGAVARWAWERVPFPEVPYAEDRLLALRMLEAGFAKAYAPGAAVVHSHAYGRLALLRRYFDEFRGLRETFGHVEPANVRRTFGQVRHGVVADRRWAAAHGFSGSALTGVTFASLRHHATRALGAQLGSRADNLPAAVRRRLSLEGRGTFDALT
jgi:glycosyltransferase involved in cell wall biosynthesis